MPASLHSIPRPIVHLDLLSIILIVGPDEADGGGLKRSWITWKSRAVNNKAIAVVLNDL